MQRTVSSSVAKAKVEQHTQIYIPLLEGFSIGKDTKYMTVGSKFVVATNDVSRRLQHRATDGKGENLLKIWLSTRVHRICFGNWKDLILLSLFGPGAGNFF